MRTPHLRCPAVGLLVAGLALACGDKAPGDGSPDGRDSAPADDAGPTAPVDADQDGYPVDEDCDDDDAEVHPGADELCDGRDNDCDGLVDDEDDDLAPYAGGYGYLDEDGDGYGARGSWFHACELPEGTVTNDEDCDDTDPAIHLFAPEHCDGVDENCNGLVDEDPVDATGGYADADGDGYGDRDAPTDPCDPDPPARNRRDCDDTDPAISPDADETCTDGVDNDCDGRTDCEDGDCDGPLCVEDCAAAGDEDGDGLSDCEDDDCWGTVTCGPTSTALSGFARLGSQHNHAYRGTCGIYVWSGSWGDRLESIEVSSLVGTARQSTSGGGMSTCGWSLAHGRWQAAVETQSGASAARTFDLGTLSGFSLSSGCALALGSSVVPGWLLPRTVGGVPGAVVGVDNPRASSLAWDVGSTAFGGSLHGPVQWLRGSGSWRTLSSWSTSNSFSCRWDWGGSRAADLVLQPGDPAPVPTP